MIDDQTTGPNQSLIFLETAACLRFLKCLTALSGSALAAAAVGLATILLILARLLALKYCSVINENIFSRLLGQNRSAYYTQTQTHGGGAGSNSSCIILCGYRISPK